MTVALKSLSRAMGSRSLKPLLPHVHGAPPNMVSAYQNALVLYGDAATIGAKKPELFNELLQKNDPRHEFTAGLQPLRPNGSPRHFHEL